MHESIEPSPDRWQDDPDRIVAAWRALLAEHHHLHGPESAAMLGVPEAALIASRVGDGAVALRPHVAKWLASLRDWGKVLFAARCELGVVLAIGETDVLEIDASEARLRVRIGRHDVAIDAAVVASGYLFEDRDAHGHTVSLNWFDGSGDCAGRVFLVSKSGREAAMPQLLAQALSPQSRRAVTTPVRAGCVAHPALEGNASGRALAEAADAARLMRRAILAVDGVPELTLALEGKGTSIVYRGPLGQPRDTPPAAHASAAECKLHARPDAAVAAWRWRRPGNGAPDGIRFDARDGGRLVLVPHGDAAAAAQWVDRILEGAAE